MKLLALQRTIRWAALGAAFLPGCTGGAADAAVAASDIVDGAPSSDETAVAVVRRRLGCEAVPEVLCTGTLIAPRVVLSAAHCLAEVGARGELEIYFGNRVGAGGTFILVSAAAVDPQFDPITHEHDVALFALASDAPVAARPLPGSSIDLLGPGASLRAVGYGATEARSADLGVQRAGTMLLGEVRATSFDAMPGPAMSCRGDSGGPVLAMIDGSEELVGITVRGDVGCRDLAFQVRVDSVVDSFISPWLGTIGELPPAWPETAVTLDEVGTYECAGDEDCPALMRCEEDSLSIPRCTLPGIGPASFDAACTTSSMCDEGSLCARVWPDGADACRCARPALAPPPPGDPGGCVVAPGRAQAWPLSLLACSLLGAFARRRRALAAVRARSNGRARDPTRLGVPEGRGRLSASALPERARGARP